MSGSTQVIVLDAPGGPELLRIKTVPIDPPGPREMRIRQTAIGVNFHDVYVRSGAYQTLKLPGVPGLEGVGVVEMMGEGVRGFALGDRIAYMDRGYGGYAAARNVAAELAVAIPDQVDDRTAAAVYLKGLTAHALVDGVHSLRGGETVLVHAAAGGVGRLLAQMAKARGSRVIGTVGSRAKVAAAEAAGCEAVILYRDEDVAMRVGELTRGRGANVVYDAIGRDTFDGSLASLAMRGHLVNYGQASGSIPPFDLARLAPKSASLTRPFVWAYVETPEKLRAAAAALFGAIADGALKVEIGGEYPLAEAARAHADLEARKPGPLVLIP